jgi:hypothetical protein
MVVGDRLKHLRLREQIPRYRPFAARELRHEPLRIGVLGERDRRQPQAGRPPFCALVEQRHAPI